MRWIIFVVLLVISCGGPVDVGPGKDRVGADEVWQYELDLHSYDYRLSFEPAVDVVIQRSFSCNRDELSPDGVLEVEVEDILIDEQQLFGWFFGGLDDWCVRVDHDEHYTATVEKINDPERSEGWYL